MPGPHCDQCATYEQRVMQRGEGEELPAAVVPCAAFAMSDAFRDWAVRQMSTDVQAQIRQAALDRVAIVKAGGSPATAKRSSGS